MDKNVEKIEASEIKRIDAKEFREKGYLQEVNRRFFHPLGLALEIVKKADGSEEFGGIWDYREDEEGIFYDLANSDQERKDKFKINKESVDKEFEKHSQARTLMMGFPIEPID